MTSKQIKMFVLQGRRCVAFHTAEDFQIIRNYESFSEEIFVSVSISAELKVRRL